MIDVNKVFWFIVDASHCMELILVWHFAEAMVFVKLPVKHTHTTYGEACVQFHSWLARTQ